MELHSLPRAPGLRHQTLFFMWAAHCSAAVGVAPFVPALPLLEKKTCMISYMKDICNWTAGPMQYIYNSKQNTLKNQFPLSRPPFLPGEMYLHLFKKHKIKKQTKHRLSFLLHALYLTRAFKMHKCCQYIYPAIPLYQHVAQAVVFQLTEKNSGLQSQYIYIYMHLD